MDIKNSHLHCQQSAPLPLSSPRDAAFRSLAYKRYHDTPLYLEWAPQGILQVSPEPTTAPHRLELKPKPQSHFSIPSRMCKRNHPHHRPRNRQPKTPPCPGKHYTRRLRVMLTPTTLRLVILCCNVHLNPNACPTRPVTNSYSHSNQPLPQS